MDLALRFSTRCATGYRRGGDRTRKLFNAAVLDEVHVRDGHVIDAAYKEPFDLLFSSPKFEYGDVVGRRGLEPLTPCASCKCATNCANGPTAADASRCHRQRRTTVPGQDSRGQRTRGPVLGCRPC